MQARTKLVIAAYFGLILFVSCHTTSHAQADPYSSSNLVAGDIRLVIDYGNSTQGIFADLSGFTVFGVLNETAVVTYTTHVFGRFIQSVNGVRNNANGNGYYWQYWVNSQLAPVAADYYVLSDGDEVLWKYCAPGQTGPGLPQGMPDWWVGFLLIAGVGSALVGVTVLIARKLR